MKFTENQQKAISHFKSPALVLAVPGAGKTTVLLNRIKYLEQVHNIDPKSILSIIEYLKFLNLIMISINILLLEI